MKWPSPRKSEKDGRLMSFSTDYVGPFFLPPSLLEFPFWLSVPSIVHPTAAAGAGLWTFFIPRDSDGRRAASRNVYLHDLSDDGLCGKTNMEALRTDIGRDSEGCPLGAATR
jgi:hypothetical protein